MPTNIFRNQSSKLSAADAPPEGKGQKRTIRVQIGKATFTAVLLDTPAASLIWSALPLYSSAQTWGQSIKFKLPLELGREMDATPFAEPGCLYFQSHEDNVIIAFGRTPISLPGEMRLPAPCNAWAATDADLTLLKTVKPGQKVSLTRA